MAAVMRVLLWTVMLVAPGGFLLLPVLLAFRRSGSETDTSLVPGAGSVGQRLKRILSWFARKPALALAGVRPRDL
jgi:hypothetical protein